MLKFIYVENLKRLIICDTEGVLINNFSFAAMRREIWVLKYVKISHLLNLPPLPSLTSFFEQGKDISSMERT
jgi:hypothetical protein